MAVHLAAAGDVFDGVLFYAVLFPHEMSGTELCQFLRIFLPTYGHVTKLTFRFRFSGVFICTRNATTAKAK